MMILQNLHTHTRYGDGRDTPLEMVRGAIAAGCGALGFSEHSPLPPAADPDGWSMAAGDVEAYRREVLSLQEKYRGRLAVFLGLELDFDASAPAGVWDYCIGSLHLVCRDGVYFSVDESPEAFARTVQERFGGDSLAFAEAYFRRLAEASAGADFQILGHFDLITKFNEGGRFFDESHPRYLDAAQEALEVLLEREVIFEVNTGAMSRGYRSIPYPAPFLLRAIRERGGRICITSDSHSANTITYAFAQAAELAADCGFQETWVLAESGFQPVSLEDFLAEARVVRG